jgi:hypothetical protein
MTVAKPQALTGRNDGRHTRDTEGMPTKPQTIQA